MSNKIYNWIPVGVAITALALTFCVADQQILRQDANDPQIRMAEDLADAMSTRENPPDAFIPAYKAELTKSTSPFIIIYDGTGQVLTSTSFLHDQVPQIPRGVLDYARTHGENRVTWQPEAGVREAIVVTYFKNDQMNTEGFVVAGRSLRDTEIRETQLTAHVFFGWLIAIIASFLASLIFSPLKIRGD